MKYKQREMLLYNPVEGAPGERAIEHKRQEESVEKQILRSAKENRGYTTPSEVALQSDVSIEEARQALDYLVSKGFAEIKVSKSGTIAYYFPDILTPDSTDTYEDI